MVNLEKYKNDGWGLSRKCFGNILTILNPIRTNKINVLEFGSGMSTEFFVDLISEGYDLNIVSYDNDIEYCTKIEHPKLKLYISELIECYDSDFISQFQNKKYNRGFYFNKISEVNTRQSNTFYDVKENDLPEIIDLMIVDGPHGNGRSIAFLHGLNHLTVDSHIVIDDYNHYDFVDKFKILYPNSEQIYISNTGSLNQWKLGGNYVIFKII